MNTLGQDNTTLGGILYILDVVRFDQLILWMCFMFCGTFCSLLEVLKTLMILGCFKFSKVLGTDLSHAEYDAKR